MDAFDVFEEFFGIFDKIPETIKPTVAVMKKDGCKLIKIENGAIFFNVPHSFPDLKLQHCAKIMKLSNLKLRVKRI